MNEQPSVPADIPLGQKTQYVSEYDSSLLFPISREQSRAGLSIVAGDLPFTGVDIWTGYELSWLDQSGKPQVAVAEFTVPCDSPHIVESKSFKLYLNSFNQTRFDSWSAVVSTLEKDLGAAVGATVGVKVMPLAGVKDSAEMLSCEFIGQLAADSIDDLAVEIVDYHPNPALLQCNSGQSVVTEAFCSDLLKTNCPVTGQPDWASVYIRYRGAPIQRESLLKYIVSFREHQDFHEHCVERMFTDILARCQPEALTVYARYTRRGGLDINPFRTNCGDVPPAIRLIRQ